MTESKNIRFGPTERDPFERFSERRCAPCSTTFSSKQGRDEHICQKAPYTEPDDLIVLGVA